MTKDLVVLAVHGMGNPQPSFWHPIRAGLKHHLTDAEYARLHVRPVHYAPQMQNRQNEYWEDSSDGLDWKPIRKFVLSSLADGVTLEHRAYLPDSAYYKVQATLLQTLSLALQTVGDPKVPVVILAHSLGAQVISNYLWDASQKRAAYGIWHNAADSVLDRRTDRGKFLALRTTRLLVTVGCNMPLFISGIQHPIPFRPPNADFQWHNYYDPDDVLGWPMQPLSPEYNALVTDKRVNAGWSPLSHREYWDADDVMEPACQAISDILGSL